MSEAPSTCKSKSFSFSCDMEGRKYHVPDWKVHHVITKPVYPKGLLHFTNRHFIRTTQGIISSNRDQVPIKLLTPQEATATAGYKPKYKYLHIGLVEVHVKPLLFQGVNGSISLFLKDKRLFDFTDSLLNTPHLNDIDDPFLFLPNLLVPVEDLDVLHHLTLHIKLHDLNMINTCYPLALLHKVYYKWVITSPTVDDSVPGFDQTNIRRQKDMSPIMVKRSDIQASIIRNDIPGRNSPGWIGIPGARIHIQFPRTFN